MKAVVYGKDNCSHCDSALMRLDLVGAKVEYIKVGEGITVQELRDKLSQEFGIGEVKTVPQIVIDGEYIGGDSALKVWIYKKVYTPNKESVSGRAFDPKDVRVNYTEEVEGFYEV